VASVIHRLLIVTTSIATAPMRIVVVRRASAVRMTTTTTSVTRSADVRTTIPSPIAVPMALPSVAARVVLVQAVVVEETNVTMPIMMRELGIAVMLDVAVLIDEAAVAMAASAAAATTTSLPVPVPVLKRVVYLLARASLAFVLRNDVGNMVRMAAIGSGMVWNGMEWHDMVC